MSFPTRLYARARPSYTICARQRGGYTYIVTNYHVVYLEEADEALNGASKIARKIYGYLYGSESTPAASVNVSTNTVQKRRKRVYKVRLRRKRHSSRIYRRLRFFGYSSSAGKDERYTCGQSVRSPSRTCRFLPCRRNGNRHRQSRSAGHKCNAGHRQR